MRILVVGSGGVGAAFAPIAARRDFYERIVFADHHQDRGRSVVERYDKGTGRFSGATVDASDPTAITELCRVEGITHVLNAVDPRFVMPIFTGAFGAGVTYLDMALSLSEPHPEEPYGEPGVKLGDAQFAQAAAWEERGLLALVGMGVEPGLSDVFARYAQDHLFGRIDEVDVRDAADLGPKMSGKTCAGTRVTGTGTDGNAREVYLYHVADNEETWGRDRAQAVVWQTAVNPVVALELLANGSWSGAGVLGPESFEPTAFLELLNDYGSPWGIEERVPTA